MNSVLKKALQFGAISIVSAAIGYEYARYEVRQAISGVFESVSAPDISDSSNQLSEPNYLIQEPPYNSSSSFKPNWNCVKVEDPQIVKGDLIFSVTNNCKSKINSVSWDVNIYQVDSEVIYDTGLLLVTDLAPGDSKQDSVYVDLPTGEFEWRLIGSNLFSYE